MRLALLFCTTLIASLLASAPANAITFSVTEFSGCEGWTPGSDCFGHLIQIGLRVEADPGEELIAVGASAYGYGQNQFVSGEAVGSLFHAYADPAVGATAGPINQAVRFGGLQEASGRVAFLQVVQSVPPFGAQPLDPGLDGVVGGGDTMFRLTFAIWEPGISRIRIGVDGVHDIVRLADGSLGSSNGFEIVVSSEEPPYLVAVPEPGAVTLIGLGLAGLAFLSRRGPER